MLEHHALSYTLFSCSLQYRSYYIFSFLMIFLLVDTLFSLFIELSAVHELGAVLAFSITATIISIMLLLLFPIIYNRKTLANNIAITHHYNAIITKLFLLYYTVTLVPLLLLVLLMFR